MSTAYLCSDPEMTFAAGALLASLLEQGDVIGLIGDLGAGKTLFVQGLAKGLRVPEETRITSPTFSLINEYRGGRLSLVHVDLYRIEEQSEFEHLGLDEMIDLAGVSAVEWCEKFPVLPKDHLLVTIAILGPQSRELSIEGTGVHSKALAARWNAALANL